MSTRFHSFCLAALMAACTPAGNPSAPPPPITGCAEGTQRCVDDTLEVCEDEAFVAIRTCTGACDSARGCVVCQPGALACDGAVSTQCLPDGSGYQRVLCDPLQGQRCDPDLGCQGACTPRNLGASYIGCDYYPTVTAQIVNTDFAFAVAVSNTSADPAIVTIDEGALPTPISFEVAPGAVGVQRLPWVDSLKLCFSTGEFDCNASAQFDNVLAAKGAYHLRSTRPVTVYQFSPLDYTDGAGSFSFSNDASLLLPTTALTNHYRVAAWQYWPEVSVSGLLAVTATADQTLVTITPRAPSNGEPSFPADTPTSMFLDRGDVVQLVNSAGDFTGSQVLADKPVQVIGGHYCTNVPLDVAACDHLEESMFPVDTLGVEYVVTAPALTGLTEGKEQVIRIIATEPDTTLEYEPALPDAPDKIADAGDFIEIPREDGDVSITASSRVLVANYMQGQNLGGGLGDPAMALVVPVEQYRKSYLFHAPTNYEVNHVNITAPVGATVTLDGVPISDFEQIGTSRFGVARVELSAGPAGDGNHSAVSDEPFGLMVYGYGLYTSYYYPAGLDLAEIPVE